MMPGKVNPVIPESLIQVAAQVIGNDAAIAVAGQGGYFELNTMMAVAAYNLLQSLSLLSAATDSFRRLCIDGLKATDQGPALVECGLMSATALAPLIGYDAAAEIAKEARDTGALIRDVARARTGLSDEELQSILDPSTMVGHLLKHHTG